MIVQSPERAPSAARIPRCDRALQQYYDVLLARILLAAPNERARVIGLTSSVRREGVSTVATHLALAAAARGEGPVLLVDANFAQPTLHQWFDLELNPGLADVLSSTDDLTALCQATAIPSLQVMAAGAMNMRSPESTGRLLASDALSEVCQRLAEKFATVIVDLPSLQADPMAIRMAPLVDGVVLLIEAEHTSADTVRYSHDLLLASGSRVLGTVLNKQRSTLPRWLR